jgi:tetratricopeptide (TPR) repeat protein
MKCNKCGEIKSDFSDICYKCDKASITTKLNNNEEVQSINVAPVTENPIVEQNKYSSKNKSEIVRIKSNIYKTIEEKLLKEYNYEELEKKEGLPVRLKEEQTQDILHSITRSKIAFPVIMTLVIFLIFSSFLSGAAKNSFEKGMKQFSHGIFRTYRDGKDSGSPVSLKNALSIWNKNEDNAKISYLLAVSCYYDYLNLKIIGANNDPHRIKDDTDEMKFYLDKSLKLKHEYPEAFYYRGLYYLEINNYSKAIIEFNKCINSAGIIWNSESKKQLKWVGASNIAKEEALKLSQEKENALKVIPPIIESSYRHLELIIDNKGRASIKDKKGNFIIIDKLCPPLPDEVSKPEL